MTIVIAGLRCTAEPRALFECEPDGGCILENLYCDETRHCAEIVDADPVGDDLDDGGTDGGGADGGETDGGTEDGGADGR